MLILEIRKEHTQTLGQQREVLVLEVQLEVILIQQNRLGLLVQILILVQKRPQLEQLVRIQDKVQQQSQGARIITLEQEQQRLVRRALILSQKVIHVLIIADQVEVIIGAIAQQELDQLADLRADQVADQEVAEVDLHLEVEDDK